MKIRTSVRNLVEFILRSGDIDNRQTSGMQAEAMQRGSRIHRKLQRQAGPSYHAEVPLKMEFEEEHYTIVLEGRADGIILSEQPQQPDMLFLTETSEHGMLVTDGETDAETPDVTIDEIKGVFSDISQMPQPQPLHLAQAKCYAFMYALQNHRQSIGVRMTYVNLDTEELRYFYICYPFEELEDWFLALMREYKKWAQFQYDWHQIRQASIQKLEFPFPYRKGQKELVSGVYRTILRKKNLFIQAPTGTGKTITTLFPAVRAVGEELGDKIFYLTAKTVTAAVAKETLDLFYEKGYRAKTVQITAKEKLCMMEETVCNPDACPYAKGHYDRVNEAVYKLLHQADVFTREVIHKQAEAYQVCPFELCLDTASWVDNIICDYNYVFDPKVYLKRFFAEGIRGDYLFLVDEAHNLVERGRSMYSAQLYKEDFLQVRRLVKSYSRKLARELQTCNQILLGYKRECEQYQYHDQISAFLFALMRLSAEYEKFLQKFREFEGRDTVLELYFHVRHFLDISEGLDENYVIYSEQEDERFKIRLYCVDPSRNLQQCLNKGRSTVFFSATLLPIRYYKSLLSTCSDNYAVYAETVFRPEQKLLLVAGDVTSRYTRRGGEEYERMAEYIYQTGIQKKGNYIVFFPSYKMMEDVYEKFEQKLRQAGIQRACSQKKCQAQPEAELLQAQPGVELLQKQLETELLQKQPETELLQAQPEAERLQKRQDADTEETQVEMDCIIQTSGMREADREKFLDEFSIERTAQRRKSLMAFCVMGGIFGEGIDLKAEQLIGVLIVGTGLPQVGSEREILKQFYDKRSGDGFAYAYRYPGMNKVLQAAGRVIRTVSDTGVIVLLDDRFLRREYRELFPREWQNYEMCSVRDVGEKLKRFWYQETV